MTHCTRRRPEDVRRTLTYVLLAPHGHSRQAPVDCGVHKTVAASLLCPTQWQWWLDVVHTTCVTVDFSSCLHEESGKTPSLRLPAAVLCRES